MRKPRYYEVLLVLACASFYIGSSFEGFEGFTGVGLGLFVFSIMKYFEHISDR